MTQLTGKIITIVDGREYVWTTPYENMGGVLRRIRRTRNLSQREVAERMGITQGRVSSMERKRNGKSPGLKWIKRFIEACGQDFKIEIT